MPDIEPNVAPLSVLTAKDPYAAIEQRMLEQAQAQRAGQKAQMDLLEKQAAQYGQTGMSDIDKASILFQAAGALASPTRSGGLMESIGAAGTAVSGPLSKAAQAERDRQDKIMQLQMARAKLSAEMGAGGVSASDMLSLIKARADSQPKPGETERLMERLRTEKDPQVIEAIRSKLGMAEKTGERERLINLLPAEKRAQAIEAATGVSDTTGELKDFKLPDGTIMSVLMKNGQILDPITSKPLNIEEAMKRRTSDSAEDQLAEAAASGIPAPERDILRNLPVKKRDEMRAKMIADGTKLLDKIETESPTSGLQDDIRKTQRFLELNYDNQNTTGPFAGKVAWMSDAGREMNAIGAEMSRKMRQPGEGATSDYDAKMFGKMTLSTDNDYKVNRNLGLAVIARKKLEMEERDFKREYLSQWGRLDGAQRHWQKYIDDNPVFAKGQIDDKGNLKVKIDNVRLNDKRKEWRDYFRDNAASQPRGSFTRGPNGELTLGGGN